MRIDSGWRVSSARIVVQAGVRAGAQILLMLTLGCAPALANTYTLAIEPQSTAVDIGIRWSPLLDQLQQETGHILQIRASSNLAEFENEILAGIPDFAFLNPYLMITSAKNQHYIPLVRSARPTTGILVTRKNGSIKNLADLQNKTIAFPAPNAFVSSLYLRALLTEKEHVKFTASHVGNQQNVYRHILHNDAQAGGGSEFSLEKEPAGIRNKLTVLYRTPQTVSHPLTASPRVPKSVTNQIVQALQRMSSTPKGRALLQQVALEGAVPADYARDYAPLEQLRLEPYVVADKK